MVKKILTKKQHTILTLLYVFRFLNSKQLQQFLQHKDHRRINSWLKDLTEKEYVIREFTPQYGAMTKPALYHLSKKGITYLRDMYRGLSSSYNEKLRDNIKRSKGFRVKCQLIADCYLILFEKNVKDFPSVINQWLAHGVTLKDNTSLSFTHAFYDQLDFPLIALLKPDMYLIYQTTKEGVTHGFINVIDAYVPKFMLHITLKKIFQILEEETWEDENTAGLLFYFICPNNMVIIYLKKILPSFLQNYYGSKVLLFHFATRNQLYKKRREHLARTEWSIISSEDEFE